MYDNECGWASIDGDVVSSSRYVGWLNHLLGTQFSMKKRFRIWENMEAYALPQAGKYSDPSQSELFNMLPSEMTYYAGGVELSYLLYIIHGTGTLTEKTVTPGSYSADVLRCKQALMVFYEKNTGEDAIRIVWDLLKQSREERRKTVIPDLEIIAELSLFLPARVIVYLTAEIKHLGFWETWKELHENIYHDEFMKQYASKELLNERKKRLEKPKYYISDDDRLYWWDGSDEVTISHETDMWLRTLANDHRKIMAQLSDTPVDSDAFLKEFFLLLVKTDQYYKRILPFQSMFYEFIENGSRKEYKAAVKLFKKLSDENRKEGEIIKYVNLSWDLASRKVTHNVGRIRLKRYLSVMANRTLRKKYFGF